MSQQRSPGVPQLLRVLNDRAALRLLLDQGPQTRSELARRTSMSKVTASQMVERLESRGLVAAIGTQAGGRGPNALIYAAVKSYAYVVGVDAGPRIVRAACADFTGDICGRSELDVHGAGDPVAVVHQAVVKAVDDAGVSMNKVQRVVLGTPGLIDPASGDIGFTWDLPSWHRGLLRALTEDLATPVVIENDVNLAAVAEHRGGAAAGVDDFVYAWFGRGLGMGVILGNRLHRGATGGAGEIGYLPVPGGELPTGSQITRRSKGSFQRLAGADAIREIARAHGFRGRDVAEVVRSAATAVGSDELFDEIARRIAIGVASVSVVLDPTLVVLGGPVGYAGGEQLARKVAKAIPRIAPVHPSVVCGAVEDDPVLRGAVRMALDAVHEEIFAET